MKTLRLLFLLVLGPWCLGLSLRAASGAKDLSLLGANHVLTGATFTWDAGAAAVFSGTLSGTPTGGTLDLSHVTLTLPAIGNASLANSAITLGTTNISLGGTATILAGLTSVSSIAITTNAVTSASSNPLALTGGQDSLILGSASDIFLLKLGAGTPSGSSTNKQGFTMARSLGGTPNVDNIRDQTALTPTGDAAMFCSFDVSTNMGGAMANNHLAAFQDRATFSGSGTLTYQWSFYSAPIFNSGTTTNRDAIWIKDPTGAGVLQNNYGILIDSLTKGTVSNYAIATMGTTPCYFGGNVTIIGTINPGVDFITGGNVRVPTNAGFITNLYYSGGWKFAANGLGVGSYPDSTAIHFITTAAANASGAGAAATVADWLTVTPSTALATFAGAIKSNNTTASTTTATGSGIFAGGVGIAGALNLGSSIKTGAPTAGSAGAWKLGAKITSTGLAVSTTNTLRVNIDGTDYSIALLTTNP